MRPFQRVLQSLSDARIPEEAHDRAGLPGEPPRKWRRARMWLGGLISGVVALARLATLSANAR